MRLTKGSKGLRGKGQVGDKAEGPLDNDLLYLQMKSRYFKSHNERQISFMSHLLSSFNI